MDPTTDIEKASSPTESYTDHSDCQSLTDSSSYDAFQHMSRIPTAQHEPYDNLERHATALSRIATQRSQHNATVGADCKPRAPTKTLPEFGAGKPYPPLLPAKEEYVVEFSGPSDPMHPQNWSMGKKLATAAMLAYTTFCATFTSSIYSSAASVVSTEFHIPVEVSTLGLSLYVFGFATGPIFWAPLSELRGRRQPLILSTLGFTIFQFAVATGKDVQTIMLCRFFGGFCGACPVAVVAAVFSDIFDNRIRGLAITIFAMTVFTGPLFASTVGGFIVQNLEWRWTEYITGIMGVLALVVDFLFLHETYPPVVLIAKAADLRRHTKNWGIHAKQEEIEIDFRELIQRNFSRPLKILFTEPIVLLLSIYMAFLYGLLYLFLTAYPIVFQEIHGFERGVGSLPYLGIIIGEFLGGIFIILTQPWYNRKLSANNEVPVPEWRLPPAMVGSIAFAAGLFWFGWSGFTADIHWAVPTVSGVLIGFGLLCIFLQALNYIVDAYLLLYAPHPDQALKLEYTNVYLVRLPRWQPTASYAPPLVRFSLSLLDTWYVEPLQDLYKPLTFYQFESLGVNWASTVLGCVATLLIPIPFLFHIYGPRIRRRSKYATDYTTIAQAHQG